GGGCKRELASSVDYKVSAHCHVHSLRRLEVHVLGEEVDRLARLEAQHLPDANIRVLNIRLHRHSRGTNLSVLAADQVHLTCDAYFLVAVNYDSVVALHFLSEVPLDETVTVTLDCDYRSATHIDVLVPIIHVVA